MPGWVRTGLPQLPASRPAHDAAASRRALVEEGLFASRSSVADEPRAMQPVCRPRCSRGRRRRVYVTDVLRCDDHRRRFQSIVAATLEHCGDVRNRCDAPPPLRSNRPLSSSAVLQRNHRSSPPNCSSPADEMFSMSATTAAGYAPAACVDGGNNGEYFRFPVDARNAHGNRGGAVRGCTSEERGRLCGGEYCLGGIDEKKPS
jgi:hypothetical protein